jgi:hypothetical protein
MEDRNNSPNKLKWLYVYILCFSLLFFIMAALIYTQTIDIFEKDMAWVFAGLGVIDFIMAFVFKSRCSD